MSPEMLNLLMKSFWETCYMVFCSTALSTLIGLPLGIILCVTRKDHILPSPKLNAVLGAIVNATRSTPFIILMVAIIRRFINWYDCSHCTFNNFCGSFHRSHY